MAHLSAMRFRDIGRAEYEDRPGWLKCWKTPYLILAEESNVVPGVLSG
jgi:hypothetical protein